MTESEFLHRYEGEKPLYNLYGRYLKETILEKAKSNGFDDHDFIIEPSYRTKDNSSIITKAFYRNKNYTDPYNDITDKVGLRFVLLTTEKVTELTRIIESIDLFNFSKDRDYEKEQLENPTTFIYQSMHYIISLKSPITLDKVSIPSKIFCEVQIRTLLQHAYSELTHDTIYKPKTKADPKTHRLVARSMALIETTDSIFVEVGNQINVDESKNEIIIGSIQDAFNSKLSFQFEKKLNDLILDVYSELIPIYNDIQIFIDQKPFILDRIKEKADWKLMYRQPIIVILYYLVSKRPNQMLKLWPLTIDELEPIYTDLGISLPTL